MADKEQIIEYPHCQSCLEYNICKAKGLNRYRPQYLNKTSCRNDCAYDYKCYFGGTPYECPEFREWCYNDMDVAQEFGHKGRYRKSLNANKCFKDFKNFIALTIEKGKILFRIQDNRMEPIDIDKVYIKRIEKERTEWNNF